MEARDGKVQGGQETLGFAEEATKVENEASYQYNIISVTKKNQCVMYFYPPPCGARNGKSFTTGMFGINFLFLIEILIFLFVLLKNNFIPCRILLEDKFRDCKYGNRIFALVTNPLLRK